MKIAALLTGKGGSTLKNKNILLVLGKPLLFYPALAAKKSKYISNFYVSSENEKILNVAGQLGYHKIIRPTELAKPDALHKDAILHALKIIQKHQISPDILVVLLANSASICTKWIDKCIEQIINDNSISAVVPVSEDTDHHPFRAKRITSTGFLKPFFDFSGKNISTNRQDLEKSYFLCHNFWVLNVKNSIYQKNGQPPWDFMGNKIKPYLIKECPDVHKKEDLRLTEEWLKKNT